MKNTFLHINTVFDEYIDFSGDKSRIDRNLVKKLANDIVTKVSSFEQDTEKVVLLKVEDYKTKLPLDCNKLIQVLYNENIKKTIRGEEVVEWVNNVYDGSGCQLRLTKECPGCDSELVKIEVDRQWDLAHPENHYKHMKHFYGHGGIRKHGGCESSFNKEFMVMRYAQHNFFNADYHVKGCLNLDQRLLVSETAEYKLDLPYVRTSIKEGWLLVSYFGVKTDEDGYRLIPNIPEIFEAITWAIEENVLYKQFRVNKDQTMFQASQYARNIKIQKIAECREKLGFPEYQAFSAFLNNHWSKVHPYYNAESNLGKYQKDRYYSEMSRLKKL